MMICNNQFFYKKYYWALITLIHHNLYLGVAAATRCQKGKIPVESWSCKKLLLWSEDMVQKASNSCSSSRFSYAKVTTTSSPPFKDGSTCCYKVGECACSACLFTICCPISMVWCCIKIPCKIGWCLAKQAKNGASCCGSQKSKYAAYSSFSDMDSDDLMTKGNDPCKTKWKICS